MGQDIYAIRTSHEKHERFEVRLGSSRDLPVPYAWRDNSPHVSLEFKVEKFEQRFEQFLIAIEPEAFTDIVNAMMKADPQEAIRAFGKALQDVQISMPDRASASPSMA
jgi:hypothetical protein